MVLHDLVHPDVLLLADLLRAEWPAARERIRLSGHPTCEGADDDSKNDDGDRSKDDDDDGKDTDSIDDADDDGKDKAGTDEPDWKRMSRKHEREAKKARAERDDAAAKLKQREDADKSEQEKAIEAARAEGEQKALSKFEEARRDDRIEMEVIKLAGRDLKIGDGDKATKARFADPEDAHLRLERAIRRGEVAYDDIYEDGKVNKDAVTDFLTDLLDDNPHLRATPNGNGGKDQVDFDGGKGTGGGDHESDMNSLIRGRRG